jgi:lysophospholipase L1-like esterase
VRTILRYGDSNTRGFDPEPGERFPEDVRWPGVLRTRLGDDYRVIEEGLSGRTTVWDDPIEGVHKNGRTYLRPCLESHSPVDLIALMLGTNDLKKRFGSSASDIAQGRARGRRSRGALDLSSAGRGAHGHGRDVQWSQREVQAVFRALWALRRAVPVRATWTESTSTPTSTASSARPSPPV